MLTLNYLSFVKIRLKIGQIMRLLKRDKKNIFVGIYNHFPKTYE